MIVLLAITGTSVVTAEQDVLIAIKYFDDVSTVIYESNYNPNVISDCITEAEEDGYVLRVNVIGSDKPGLQRYAEVELDYYYQIPLLGIKELKTRSKII